MFGRVVLIGVLASLSSVGCGSNADAIRKEVIPRATFELSCPGEQLTGQCLDESCNTVGVSGCGKKATYVYLKQPHSLSGQWVMNTAGGNVQGAPEPAAPTPPPQAK